jgi:hypothetical protein
MRRSHTITLLKGMLLLWGALACLIQTASATVEKAVPLKTLDAMPVKEITVFKDGHALVLHEGEMPTDSAGNIEMDYLPRPVLGTFWPYCTDKNAKLESVVSGRRRVRVERTALEIRELIEANVGAAVTITEKGWQDRPGETYTATILQPPVRTSEEMAATSDPHSEERLPERGNIALLQTNKGVRAIAFDRILDVTFTNKPNGVAEEEEFRDLLTLHLSWASGEAGKQVRTGLMYVERGVRWIPNYKVEIDGKGAATIRLQATIINELTDLQDVTADLVVGVPSFEFKDMVDPISLQETISRVASQMGQESGINVGFSNAIMSQVAAREPHSHAADRGSSDDTLNLGPEISATDKNEDLFVFTVQHLTLRKGQRAVIPVAEFQVSYEDIHKLHVPFHPPQTIRQSFNDQQMRELARLMAAPKVQHVIRLNNASKQPFTTAPALILREGRVLAQGLMTYTPAGGKCDLAVTTAVDVQIEVSDAETGRIPNALTLNDNHYSKINLKGTISLVNRKDAPVELEVVRDLLGFPDSASDQGKVVTTGICNESLYDGDSGYPDWRRWGNWPWWWSHVNSTGRVTWNVTLQPGTNKDLAYSWHYFWL